MGRALSGTKTILVLFTFTLSAGCSLKKDFLNQVLKSTSDVSLTSLGENHKVGANKVLIAGYCAYGSKIEFNYGTGFDASSATTATCDSCSTSENPDCGGFWHSVGKYTAIAVLSGSNGTRQMMVTSKDNQGNVLSTTQRNFTYEPLTQEAYAKPSLNSGRSLFGRSVDIDGDTMVVGTQMDPNRKLEIQNGTNVSVGVGSSGTGSAYVFRKISGSWVQEAYLKPILSITGDYFGFATAISGDTIAVGAYADDRDATGVYNVGDSVPSTTTTASAGSVYIFKRTGTTWEYQAYLKAPNAGASDIFGYTLDISGDYVVVGARDEDGGVGGVQNGSITTDDNSVSSAGAAYVYKRTGSLWAFQAYLKSPNPDASDTFSVSLSISGDVIVVGASAEDSNLTGVSMGTTASADNTATNSGAAYVFRRSGNNWVQEAFLKGHSINNSDVFGSAVAVSGNTIVVGAYGEDSNVTGVLNGTSGSTNNGLASSGAAYVFYYDTLSSTWAQQAYLKGSDTDSSDEFGAILAIDGDTIAVSAWEEDSNATGVSNGTSGSANDTVTDAGAVYVFKRTGSSWAQESYLKPAVTGIGYKFGTSIAISGNTIAVGEPYDRSLAAGITMGTTASSDNANNHVGSAYVFTRSGSNWTQEAYLKPSVKMSINNWGGTAADLDGDTLVVGNFSDMNTATTITNGSTVTVPTTIAQEHGSAYVFRRVSGTWVQEAYLKSPNSGTSDQFGVSVSISADTIVVGANGEDNSTAGIQNGSLVTDNNSALTSGAAYVFTRTGSTWSFQSYLKPATVVAGDNCGRSVAVNVDTIAVACDLEDSSASGVVNGAAGGPTDTSAADSGAVYIYKRTGSSWAQEAYIKPAIVTAGTRLGYYNIEISGDVLAIGSTLESSNATGIQNGTNGGSTNTSLSYAGAVHIFRRTGSNWAQEAYIKAPYPYAGERFGNVSLKGDDLAVGSIYDASNHTGIQNTSNPTYGAKDSSQSGAAYVYKYESGLWSLKAYIKPPVSATEFQFGTVSAIENDTLFIGAPRDSSSYTEVMHGANAVQNINSTKTYSGAVYVYRRLNDEWYLSDYIKAPNSMEQATFGRIVMRSGQNLAIAAPLESGDTTGVTNGPPPSIASPVYYSGAMYMYRLDY